MPNTGIKLIIGTALVLLLTQQIYSYLFKLPAAKESGPILENIAELSNWIPHAVGKKDSRNISIGDVNDDGFVDLIVIMGYRHDPQPTDGVYWYMGPNWEFQRLSDPIHPIRWGSSLTTGDADNDGDLDVVVLSFDLSNVYLAINPGKDAVADVWPVIIIKEASQSHRDGERVEFIDIDNDGYKDVVFPRGRPKEVRVLFNPKGSLHKTWKDKLIGLHVGSDAHDIAVTDMDNDNDLDIVVASGDGNPDRGAVFWYQHPDGASRTGKWKRHEISTVSANYGGLQLDDIDRDGWVDVFVNDSHGGPGEVMWYRNPGQKTDIWERFVIDVQYAPHAALAFDADGDGGNELWVPDTGCCGVEKRGGIALYKLIDASSNKWLKFEAAPPPWLCRQSYAIDMDSDSDLDVVCGSGSPRSVEVMWWENRRI